MQQPHQSGSSVDGDNSHTQPTSLPHSSSPLDGAKLQNSATKINASLASSSSSLTTPLSVPSKHLSLSPSSRNNRVSPSPALPAVPPPLPSKPPTRSRPSSASRGSKPPRAEGEADDSASALLHATGLTIEADVTHVSPHSTAHASGSKKLKTDSPPPLLPSTSHPSFVNGGMTLSHFPAVDDDDADCTIITTTVVTATEREETRQVIPSSALSVQNSAENGEDDTEPGAAGSDQSASKGPGLRLGLRLGGFEEAKEESEITTIPVMQEEEQKQERRRPKLTLQYLSCQSPHNVPRLPLSLPTATSRPHTPQKGLLLHADDSSADGAAGDSIIITTTTTTTTTTTSTQMRLLPLAATPSSAASSAPFVPSKQSNMATTQSTSSRAAKLDFFLHDCTLITPTLYIGGQIVASDLALLRQHGITHVVNACGAVCDNYFPDDFSYYRLYLQDKGSEDVLCILYEVFQFVAAARAAGGKVLIHCQQGVSRSTVLGIGYLMMAGEESDSSGEWTYADYQTAYSRVRSKRGISSPNLGFVCQLLAWSRRLLGRCAFSSSLYRFAPHNANDRKLVNKWVDTLDCSAFDARFILLLQSPYAFYLWVGEDVSAEREAASAPLIRRVVHNLQTYEFGVWNVVRIRRRAQAEAEEVTDVTDVYGLSTEERPAVERRREEVREHAPADESDEEDMGGVEGDGASGGGEEGDTDRMRERTNRTHAFDAERPADFFYAVMGGRPAWHTHNAALNDEVDADSALDALGEERGRGVSRATSLRSAASSTSSRISVSVQKLQISPTLSGVDRRTSATSLSISPRSQRASASLPAVGPPLLPARPPRKDSRGEAAA